MKFLRNLILVIFTLFFGQHTYAQIRTSSGTEFWLGFMQNNVAGSGDLSLIISSEGNASGEIVLGNTIWSQNFTLNSGSIVVNIPAGLAEVSQSQITGQKAIHITSDQPVTVAAVNYESSTADATQIWPAEWLGSEYFVASYSGQNEQESEFLIVATEDDTEVIITPSATTDAGNLAGQSFVISLMKGETYLVKAAGAGDLSGTHVSATESSGHCRPFAVFSGAVCAFVPLGCSGACDHLWEQNFPLNFWGHEYYITPWVFDTDPDYSISIPQYSYRVFASSNNTMVSIDGITTVNLDAGEFQEYNAQTGAHCILANAPVAVVQYMEGISCGGNGDPSMCVLVPSDQRSGQLGFSSIETGSLAGHYVNIVTDVYSLGAVTLDGNIINASLFQSFPGCNEMIWCGLELNSGSHSVASPGGLNVVLYGHGQMNSGVAESYAFSPGASYYQEQITADTVLCGASLNAINAPPSVLDPYWKLYTQNDILATGPNYALPQPLQNEVYELFYTDPISGCADSMIYSVESPASLNVQINPEDVVLCEHTGIYLQTSVNNESGGIYQFSWSPENGLDNAAVDAPFASPDNSITYSVHVETLGGCAEGDDQIFITVNDGNIAEFDLQEEVVQQCLGAADTLHLSVEETIWRDNFDPGISWGVWSDIFGGEESVICGSVSGNGLYFNGTYPREAITIPLDLSAGGSIYFALKVSNDAAPCDNAEPGDNVVLAYSVSNGPWINIQTFYEASYPDFVFVSVPIPIGAMNASTRLRWRQVGSYLPNQDNWTLDNMYVGLEAASDYVYQWSPVLGLNMDNPLEPIVQASSSGYFEVSMIDSATGCNYSDSVYADVGMPFSLDLFPDTVLCELSSLSLFAQPDLPGSYTWSWSPSAGLNGMYSSTPVASPAETITYHVEVNSDQGCMNEGEISIQVSQLGEVLMLSNDSVLCLGESTELSITAGGEGNWLYSWTPSTGLSSTNTDVTIASPQEDAVYTCVVVDPLTGCESSDGIALDVSTPFTLQIIPDSVVSCAPGGTILEVITEYPDQLEYAWSPENAVSETETAQTTLNPGFNGTLHVTAYDGGGCFATDSIQVVQIEEMTDLGADVGFCEDESLILDCGWGSDHTILWNTGEETPQIEVSEGGVYSVEVWSPEGCYSTDQIEITSYSYPQLDLGNDTSFCQGEVLLLESGLTGLNILWNNGLQSPSIYVVEGGIYSVIADNGYCFSEDSILVEKFPMPVKPFAEEIELCFDFNETGFYLDARNEGAFYFWNNDSTGRVIPVTEAGSYSVQITLEGNCSANFSTLVTDDCPQTLFVPNSFTPDGDGINDVWKVYGQNIQSYRIRLFNRLGEVFWDNSDIETPWLGQRRDGDYYVEAGVYPYLIDYQEVNADGSLGEFRQLRGFVTLIR